MQADAVETVMVPAASVALPITVSWIAEMTWVVESTVVVVPSGCTSPTADAVAPLERDICHGDVNLFGANMLLHPPSGAV